MVKLKLSELNQNPFKKYINKGKLNPDRIAVLKESIEHGTLPEHFYVRRRKDGKYELTSGHHKVSALKSAKGADYSVDITLVDFSDEQMLIDMVRENITQRDTDFHDTREGIVLSRNWLQSESTDVKQFNNGWKQQQDNQGKFISDKCYRSIATFLSKNGKAVSYGTVSNYLKIHDRLCPELLHIVEKQDHATDASGKKDKKTIGVRDAIKISTITDNWNEQKDLVEALRNTREQHGNEKQTNLTAYNNASDDIKQQVRQGNLDLADVEDEIDKQELKVEVDKRPKTIFIPNFAQRIKDFDKNIKKLERQIEIFSKIFHSSEFKKRYDFLKPKQKEKLNFVIFDIRERIQKCQVEIEFFMKQLPDNIIMVEAKK